VLRIFTQKKIWKNDGYITYRRFWLDALLKEFSVQMRGTVIDLGGKRENKRGNFIPPEEQANAWWYINLDLTTNPNIFADVTHTPIQSGSVDCILCTEVLEHLPDPQSCVDEIHRLLCNGGMAYVSVPFFYPVHADPYDFQRFTEDGLRHLFREFASVEVHRMGGYAGTLGLLLELGRIEKNNSSFAEKNINWLMKWISRWLIHYDLVTFNTEKPEWHKFTTGYFIRAQR